MAIDYQSSFNSGELSGRMNGRSSLEVYNNGCSRLENFFVLPQGGVERRTGTEFIAETAGGFNFSDWVTVTDYIVGDNIAEGADNYRCITAHTSSATFATDAANWEVLPSSGSAEARFIPFSFSSTQSYTAEIGDGYITMWDDDGISYDVTGWVPYSGAELAGIEYAQKFDILYLSSPDVPIQLLKRTSITPTFEIEEVEYDYPPLTAPDDETVSITPSATTGEITITASDDLFTAEWIGSYIGINQARGIGESKSGSVTFLPYTSSELDVEDRYYGAQLNGNARSDLELYDGSSWSTLGPSNRQNSWSYSSTAKGGVGHKIRIRVYDVAGSVYWSLSTDAATAASGPITDGGVGETLNVSYSRWNVKTSGLTGSWAGRLVAQRSTDGGANWQDYIVLQDTTDLDTENIAYSSPSYEGRDTYIRLSYSGTGTVQYNLSSEDPLQTGLVLITGYNSTTEVTATVKSTLAQAEETIFWMQSAFSNFRGWPRSIAFHQDRLWIAGSGVDPATIYASVSGDYGNYKTGVTSDMAIERIPDSPELAQWLKGRTELIMGTEGGAIAIRSVDNRELIDASNIVTASQAVFGASEATAIEANDVVVYSERSKKKLRELVYNDTEENYRSADMNILNNEILNGEIKELFLQQQPDQIIWAVLEDGTCSHLTYERVQEVIGWGRFITNGLVKSACRLPTPTSEDEIWMCVNRNGTYTIERTKPRADADWYVDSGVQWTITPENYATDVSGELAVDVSGNYATDGGVIEGLDHLEGLEVRCVVDGVNDGLYTVFLGTIAPTTTTGTNYLIGLDYDSIMRTMPIEPGLMQKLPNSRVKGAVKAIAEFYPTTGGSIREKNKTGEIFDEVEFSGEKKFNIASDWTREKIIEIKQHLPYPMTILSLAVWTEVKGG